MSGALKVIRHIAELPAAYGLIQRLFREGPARRRFVDEVLRPRPGDSILDLGCGPARLLEFLPGSVRYTGVDENPRYLKAAARRYGSRGAFLEARLGTSTRLGLREARFDLVLAVAVLHHLADNDAMALVRLALHHLAAGGRFITLDPVLYDRQPPLSRLLARADRGRHVRRAEAYSALLAPFFPKVETRLFTDLAPFSYAHFAMVATADS